MIDIGTGEDCTAHERSMTDEELDDYIWTLKESLVRIQEGRKALRDEEAAIQELLFDAMKDARMQL